MNSGILLDGVETAVNAVGNTIGAVDAAGGNENLKLIIEYILGGLLIVFAVALVIVIMLQEGNTQGLGTITGGADTFLSKNKARSLDAFLARWTKAFVVGFVLVVLGINGVEHFM